MEQAVRFAARLALYSSTRLRLITAREDRINLSEAMAGGIDWLWLHGRPVLSSRAERMIEIDQMFSVYLQMFTVCC